MKDLVKILQSLYFKMINTASVGGGAGSIIKLELETNDYLFIYCTWRLEYNNMVLSTSDDDCQAITGLMANTMKKIEGKKIIEIDISPQYDLTFILEESYKLKVFCNVSYSNEGYSNWELCSPQNNLTFTINNHFNIDITTYC